MKAVLKRKWSYSILLCFIFILSACGNAEDDKDNTTKSKKTTAVSHELGTADVPENPKRVVTLELGLTETVVPFDVIPVGVADDDRPERIAKNIYDKIKGYTSVGTRAQPNLEVIRTLNPDLIIADSDRHASIYKELSNIAPTVALKDDAADYSTVLKNTKSIGTALGKEEQGKKLIEEHENNVQQLKDNIKSADKDVLIAGFSEGIFEVQTSSFFTPSFFTTIGLPYAFVDEKETSKEMTVEQLLTINPETLIISINEDEPSIKESLKNDKLWNKLQAVQAGNVYEVNHNDWSRRRSLTAINDRMEEFKHIFVHNK
ncbi:ABC transporter substrate-binding protein [Niallia sp. 01092]|uniref:ABC transporter substrate-binding protein n=1 Tax=unclassified Niallia TaxID=2837522 RepID=UPI003FD58668